MNAETFVCDAQAGTTWVPVSAIHPLLTALQGLYSDITTPAVRLNNCPGSFRTWHTGREAMALYRHRWCIIGSNLSFEA